MVTIQITLPDDLTRQAQSKGLLAPERIARWLREELTGAAKAAAKPPFKGRPIAAQIDPKDWPYPPEPDCPKDWDEAR